MVGVLWRNVAGRVVFVNKWGSIKSSLVGSREDMVYIAHLHLVTHYYLLELGS